MSDTKSVGYNQNQSNITNFRLDVPDLGDMSNPMTLFCQTVSIPGFRMAVTELPLNQGGTGRMNIPGTTSEFEPLIIRVLCDEDLQAWISVYRWMLSINDYARQNPTMWDKIDQPKAVTLTILNNTKTESVVHFNYYAAFPSEIGEVEYSFTEEGDPAVTFTVILHYKFFEAFDKNGNLLRPYQSDPQVSKR